MTDTAPQQRRYEHRHKHLIQTTAAIAIAVECAVPASTGLQTRLPLPAASTVLQRLSMTQE